MAISINMPKDDEQALRAAWGDGLDRAAREGLLIESYRAGKISLGYLAELLGLETSIEAQGWLSKRGIHLNYSLEDLEADRKSLATLFPDFKP
ncbi:MAG: UPF0175 family protein [Phycisphaerales bacterium]